MWKSKFGKAVLVGFCALSTLPAAAATLRECTDYTSGAQSLAEPWEKNTRTFLNGDVRIALIDTGGEPVCCSTHLLILAADKSDPQQGRVCRVLSNDKDLGFEWIFFDKVTATYHPARGLELLVPFKLYVDGLQDRRGLTRVSISTRDGVIRTQ